MLLSEPFAAAWNVTNPKATPKGLDCTLWLYPFWSLTDDWALVSSLTHLIGRARPV